MKKVIFFKFAKQLNESEWREKIGGKEITKGMLVRNNFPSDNYYFLKIKDKVVCENKFVNILALRKKKKRGDYENLFTRQTISNQPCLLRLEYDCSDNVNDDCNLRAVLSDGMLNFRLTQEIVFNTTYEDDGGRIEIRGTVERNESIGALDMYDYGESGDSFPSGSISFQSVRERENIDTSSHHLSFFKSGLNQTENSLGKIIALIGLAIVVVVGSVKEIIIIMRKCSQRYREIKDQIPVNKHYELTESLVFLQNNNREKIKNIKVSFALSQSKQKTIRASKIILPHPVKKERKIVVVKDNLPDDILVNLPHDDNIVLLTIAELQQKITGRKKSQWGFTKLLAHPASEKQIKSLEKILGPAGLYPAPKKGNLTENIRAEIEKFSQGEQEIKSDKSGNIQLVMPNSEKVENFLNQYLETYYPRQERNSITELNFYGGNFTAILKGEKLDLSDFTSLEKLDCNEDYITELNVSRCSQLKILFCCGNRLESLDLSENPNLIELDCSLNKLTALNLINNPKLEMVEVQLNFIAANLDVFSHLTELRVLNLAKFNKKNKFSGSLQALENCRDLKKLYLTCQPQIEQGLEYLPTEKLTVFEYRGSAFEDVLKNFDFGEGQEKRSILASVLAARSPSKQAQITETFEDLFRAEKNNKDLQRELSLKEYKIIAFKELINQNYDKTLILIFIAVVVKIMSSKNKITNIVQELDNLSLGEIDELITNIKERFNIQEEVMVGPTTSITETKTEEKVINVSLKLTGIKEGANKMQFCKEIVNIIKEKKGETINLIQAKNLLEEKKTILENIPRPEAEKIQKTLEEKGGLIEIKEKYLGLNRSPLFQDLPNKDFGKEQKLSYDNFFRTGFEQLFAAYFPAEFSNYNNQIRCGVGKITYEEPKISEEESRIKALTDDVKQWVEKSFKIGKFVCQEKIQEKEEKLKITLKLLERQEKNLIVEFRCVGEKKINFCQLPKITAHGNFIINGHDKVVVFQSVRAPSVYFFTDENQEIYGEIIPFKGPWLNLSFNKKKNGIVELRFLNSGVTINLLDLMKTYQITPEDLGKLFGQEDLNKEDYPNAQSLEPGIDLPHFLFNRPNSYFVFGNLGRKKFNQKSSLWRQVSGQILAENLYDNEGDLLLSHDTILNEKNLAILVKAYQEKKLVSPFLSPEINNLYLLKIKAPHQSQKTIPVVGFATDLSEEKTYFDLADLICAVSLFLNLRYGLGKTEKEEDKDKLENQVIRRVGDLFYNLIETKLGNFGILLQHLCNTSPLFQLQNQNNPLAKASYNQRISVLGRGGFSSSTTTFSARNVGPSHLGRLDLVETPEGQNAGLVRNLTIRTKINDYGQMVVPYYPVQNGIIVGKIVYLTREEDSSLAVRAEKEGEVVYVDSQQVIVKESTGGKKIYHLKQLVASNKNVLDFSVPRVKKGDHVAPGQIIASDNCIKNDELALEGYNFEDGVVINERLVKKDILTSFFVKKYTVIRYDTKYGEEIFTNLLPYLDPKKNHPREAQEKLAHLDEDGIVKVGSRVKERDVLVGKRTPQPRPTDESEEDSLLLSLLGEASRNFVDSSLYLPSGEKGEVYEVQRKKLTKNKKELEVVEVYVAQERKIEVGDKGVNRYGGKWTVAKIAPAVDLPFDEEGKTFDLLINPLSVPTRLNIGQLLETILSEASLRLGEKLLFRPFNTLAPNTIQQIIQEAGIKDCGNRQLFDGRTGQPFANKIYT
ncbi:11061_t:CDS:10, partial [Racocetra fulgida]